MHGHFYGNFTGNLAHAQSVCTRPFSRGEGPGDEANAVVYIIRADNEKIKSLKIEFFGLSHS